MNDPLFSIDASGWVHLCPVGEFPVNHPTPGGVKRLIQVCDNQALDSICLEFAAAVAAGGDSFPGLLVDFDHFSEDVDKPSTAAGWLLDVRREKGDLVGFVRWTETGLKAVQGGDFRFLSPTWLPSDCEDLGPGRIRPLKLSGAGLTNKPNISTMRPICNRRAAPAAPPVLSRSAIMAVVNRYCDGFDMAVRKHVNAARPAVTVMRPKPPVIPPVPTQKPPPAPKPAPVPGPDTQRPGPIVTPPTIPPPKPPVAPPAPPPAPVAVKPPVTAPVTVKTPVAPVQAPLAAPVVPRAPVPVPVQAAPPPVGTGGMGGDGDPHELQHLNEPFGRDAMKPYGINAYTEMKSYSLPYYGKYIDVNRDTIWAGSESPAQRDAAIQAFRDDLLKAGMTPAQAQEMTNEQIAYTEKWTALSQSWEAKAKAKAGNPGDTNEVNLLWEAMRDAYQKKAQAEYNTNLAKALTEWEGTPGKKVSLDPNFGYPRFSPEIGGATVQIPVDSKEAMAAGWTYEDWETLHQQVVEESDWHESFNKTVNDMTHDYLMSIYKSDGNWSDEEYARVQGLFFDRTLKAARENEPDGAAQEEAATQEAILDQSRENYLKERAARDAQKAAEEKAAAKAAKKQRKASAKELADFKLFQRAQENLYFQAVPYAYSQPGAFGYKSNGEPPWAGSATMPGVPLKNRGPMTDPQRRAMFAKKGGMGRVPQGAPAPTAPADPVPGRLGRAPGGGPPIFGPGAPRTAPMFPGGKPNPFGGGVSVPMGAPAAMSLLARAAGSPGGRTVSQGKGPQPPVIKPLLPGGSPSPVRQDPNGRPPVGPVTLARLIGNRRRLAYQAFRNRGAMTDEQRRAMFARMNGGGGGSGPGGGSPGDVPAEDPGLAEYKRQLTRFIPDAPTVPVDVPSEPEPVQGGGEQQEFAGDSEYAPGGLFDTDNDVAQAAVVPPAPPALTYDAATRRQAKQVEIDAIVAALGGPPVGHKPEVLNLKKLDARLKAAGVPMAERFKQLDAAKVSNAAAKAELKGMYKAAKKACGGNRLKAEVMVQKQLAAMDKDNAKAAVKWQAANAVAVKKIGALKGDILEIDAKANEAAAKQGTKEQQAAAKAASARLKDQLKAQVAADKEAARVRVAAAREAVKAATAAAKAAKPVDQAAAYKTELAKRKTYWDAVLNNDLTAAQAMYPTADVKGDAARAAAAMKGAGKKDSAAALAHVRAANPVRS